MAVLTQSKGETVTSKKMLNNQPTQEAQWLAGSDPQSPEGPCPCSPGPVHTALMRMFLSGVMPSFPARKAQSDRKRSHTNPEIRTFEGRTHSGSDKETGI